MIVLFEPDAIESELRKDLPSALRMLAGAIESGEVDGRVMRCQSVAGGFRDDRAHVVVSLDLAAEILRNVMDVPELGTGERKMLL